MAHLIARVFNFGEFKDGKAQQPLPSTLVGAKEGRISTFFDLCYEMTLKLNTLFGIGLGVYTWRRAPKKKKTRY